MGFFDALARQTEAITRAAGDALEFTRKLARETEQKLREAIESAESLAAGIKNKVEKKAEELQRDLEGLAPSFDGKLQEITDQIAEVAMTAADEGVDIMEAIDGAVQTAIQEIQDALNGAIDAINDFLKQASEKLFKFLEGYLPEFIITGLKSAVKYVLNKLTLFGEKLKSGISIIAEKTKAVVHSIVGKIRQVIGPIWKVIRKLWEMLFGVEPEQCNLTIEWFGERMRRTKKELLQKRSGEPIRALIKSHTFFELLPPDQNSWMEFVLSYFERVTTTPISSLVQARIRPLLFESSPRPGNLLQLTLDVPLTDWLGGRQCVQISVLYYRWRTEDFRKISSGFIGILFMISALGEKHKTAEDRPLRISPREPPLHLSPATISNIYKEIEPHLRLQMPSIDQETAAAGGGGKHTSRSVMSKDHNGIWTSYQLA